MLWWRSWSVREPGVVWYERLGRTKKFNSRSLNRAKAMRRTHSGRCALHVVRYVRAAVGVEARELADVVAGDGHHLVVLRRQQLDQRPGVERRGWWDRVSQTSPPASSTTHTSQGHVLERLEVVGLERLDVLPPELLRVHDAPPQLAGVHLRHVPLERAVRAGAGGGGGGGRRVRTSRWWGCGESPGTFRTSTHTPPPHHHARAPLLPELARVLLQRVVQVVQVRLQLLVRPVWVFFYHQSCGGARGGMVRRLRSVDR